MQLYLPKVTSLYYSPLCSTYPILYVLPSLHSGSSADRIRSRKWRYCHIVSPSFIYVHVHVLPCIYKKMCMHAHDVVHVHCVYYCLPLANFLKHISVSVCNYMYSTYTLQRLCRYEYPCRCIFTCVCCRYNMYMYMYWLVSENIHFFLCRLRMSKLKQEERGYGEYI